MCSWSFPTHCTGVENSREEGQGLTVSDYTHLWGLEEKVETNFATACSVLVAYTLWKETENKYFFISTDRWKLKELPKFNSNSGCFWEGIQNFTFERENIGGNHILHFAAVSAKTWLCPGGQFLSRKDLMMARIQAYNKDIWYRPLINTWNSYSLVDIIK